MDFYTNVRNCEYSDRPPPDEEWRARTFSRCILGDRDSSLWHDYEEKKKASFRRTAELPHVHSSALKTSDFRNLEWNENAGDRRRIPFLHSTSRCFFVFFKQKSYARGKFWSWEKSWMTFVGILFGICVIFHTGGCCFVCFFIWLRGEKIFKRDSRDFKIHWIYKNVLTKKRINNILENVPPFLF